MSSNTDNIDNEDLKRCLNIATKQMLIKTQLSIERSGGAWYDIMHDSTDEINRQQRHQREYQEDYYKNHDWNTDDEYLKDMKRPMDEIDKYGIGGKKQYEENQEEQRLFDFSTNHPILGKLFYGI